MVKVEYGETIGRAFKFAINLKLLIFMYFFHLIIFVPFIGLGAWLWKAGVFEGGFDPASNIGTIVGLVLGLILFFLVLFLVSVLINMIIIDLYKSKKSLGDSLKNIKPRFLRMLGIVIVVGLISALVGAVPGIGVIFSIIVSLIFLFMYQLVVIGKKKFRETFESSWKLFRHSFGDVFLTWLINGIIGLVIVFIFAIPIIVMVVSTVVSAISGDFSAAGSSLFTNIPMLVVGGLLLMVGITISTLFKLGFYTDAYMQLEKKAKF
jgi:hypothetical protein